MLAAVTGYQQQYGVGAAVVAFVIGKIVVALAQKPYTSPTSTSTDEGGINWSRYSNSSGKKKKEKKDRPRWSRY